MSKDEMRSGNLGILLYEALTLAVELDESGTNTKGAHGKAFLPAMIRMSVH
jgi:hypothetical protein